MLLGLTTLLRIASRLACVVVVVSFAIFAYEQTSEASSKQQNELIGTGADSSSLGAHNAPKRSRENAVHRDIDEAAETLTSPFSGITAGSKSQWAVRGVGTLMALIVYGIGVGYLTRMLRIRV